MSSKYKLKSFLTDLLVVKISPLKNRTKQEAIKFMPTFACFFIEFQDDTNESRFP